MLNSLDLRQCAIYLSIFQVVITVLIQLYKHLIQIVFQ